MIASMQSGPNRRALAIGMGVYAASLAAARAQSAWPDRPVRVIVPFGPGGLADVTMRIVAEKMSALIGQQMVIINQPGAGGVAAARAVMAAPADGYTLAMFTNGTAISVPLVKNLQFDPVADFAPVSSLGFFDFLFLTRSASPYRTLQDFIAAAKAKPGALNVGTINIGSSQNLSAALFKSLAGVDFAVVPYRATPEVVTATVRGDVDLMIDGYVAAKSLIADGQLRALATSGPVRFADLADTPTAMQAGVPGFEVTSWNAVFAPKGTPDVIVAALNAKLREALADPEVKRRLLELGIEAKGGAPAEIAERLRADIAKWGEVIEKTGVPRQ